MDFCWVTINVRDMEESLAFYTGVLGLRVNRRVRPKPETEIAFLGVPGAPAEASGAPGGTEVELVRNSGRNDISHGKDISIGFTVESLDAKIAELAEKGIGPVAGPFQPGPSIRFAYIQDPNGVKVQLVESARR